MSHSCHPPRLDNYNYTWQRVHICNNFNSYKLLDQLRVSQFVSKDFLNRVSYGVSTGRMTKNEVHGKKQSLCVLGY
jgi:hypothetical protein